MPAPENPSPESNVIVLANAPLANVSEPIPTNASAAEIELAPEAALKVTVTLNALGMEAGDQLAAVNQLLSVPPIQVWARTEPANRQAQARAGRRRGRCMG